MMLFFLFTTVLATVVAAFLAYLAVDAKGQLASCKEGVEAVQVKSDHCSKKLSAAQIQFKALHKKYQGRKEQWALTQSKLLGELQGLEKYKGIEGATQIAETLERDAREKSLKASKLSEELLAKANEDAKAELKDARIRAKTIEEDVRLALDSATIESSKIIAEAKEKAKEIAGSAYEAMENASLYERTAKAMKNVIKGYGSEYIIPEASLLDDLIEDFSYADAGRSLKLAKERTKQMIRNGTAAACDYVESNRRDTAISFVLDAFNGKVDSLLSRTKHDNAGKLAQSIRDSRTLVNFNGKAFRDARISEQYLESRLDELKWAEICQQLALKDREEQRYAKEIIREEARVQKEQQKALKEAAKEEEMLQKALLQAQEQFNHASGEQRDMYEQRLKDMEIRLTEAMERKERAISMAEKTKKGYVYIISNVGSFGDDVFKIGLTRRDNPLDRVRELGDASVPFGFDIHAMILSDNAPELENKLHRHFAFQQINKVNHRKEFFRVSLTEIKEQIDSMELTTGVRWTLTSEAKEYRESLAIESNSVEKEAWERRQVKVEDAS